MKQRTIKAILYTAILCMLTLQPIEVWSQHGIGTASPDASSILDLSAVNKGVLLPRVALTGTNDIATIATPATSLLVYNTATAGTGGTSVSPGYYYWTGSVWQRISGDNLGNHLAIQNIQLGGHYLSNDGGNEGIHIDNSGNVGIGNTANSSAKLKVTGNNYYNTDGLTATTSSNSYFNGHLYLVPVTSNISYIQSRRSNTSGDASLRFRTTNAGSLIEAIDISKEGNVAIGTTSAGAKLDVNGQIKIRGGSPSVNKVLTSDANGLATWQNAQGDNLGNHTATENIKLSGNYLSNDGGNEGVFVATDGKVGIGTNAPAELLDINGKVRLRPQGVGSHQLTLTNGDGSAGSGSLIIGSSSTSTSRFRLLPAGNDIWFQNTNNSGKIYFSGVNAADLTGNIIFKTTGNVGIGTTSPNAKLEVAGQVKITGGTPGANKVLTSDANGLATWQNAQGDNLGNHTATENIKLSGNYLSNDGGSEGIFVSTTGNVGIANNSPNSNLDISSTSTTRRNINIRRTDNLFETGIGFQNSGDYYEWNIYQSGDVSSNLHIAGGSGVADITTLPTRLSLLSNGNVGIGTTSPGTKLEVAGQVKITGGTPGANKVLTSDANGLATWQNAQGDNLGNHTATQNIQLGGNYLSNDGGNEGISINNSGNLGIGTTAKTNNKLYIKDGGTVSANEGIMAIHADDTSPFIGTYYNDAISSSIPAMAYYANGVGDFIFSNQGNHGIHFSTNGYTNKRMTITNSGNVGIGNDTPGAKLEIAGQVKITGGTPGINRVLTSDANGLATWQAAQGDNLGNHTATQDILLGTHKIKGTGATPFEISESHLRFAQNLNADSQIRSWGNLTLWANDDNGGTEHMIFKVGGTGTGTERMRLDATGNLGIGVTSPSTKMDVNGQIKIRGGAPGINKVLTSDANGLASWQTASGDNLGNHIATGNIQLGGHYLSNDGGNEGVAVDNSGNVGIGTTSPGAKLEVTGQVKITGGSPGNGKILISDANGLASWQSINAASEIVEETEGYIPNMTSSSQDGFVATSYNEAEVSSTFSGWHIFNSGLLDYYSSSINFSNPPIFQIQLPESIKVFKYYIQEDNGNFNFIPTEWTVEGSNNGTDWTILDSQTNFDRATISAGAFIELSPVPDAYSYYRLKVTRTGGYNMLEIKTFQIYRAVEENILQGLASVLRAGENGDEGRIINVSQVGINTSSPTATLSVNGDANKTGSTAWGTFSDIRLKDVQGNYTKGLQDISALHTVMYKYKKDNSLGWNSQQQQYGLIAQEVQHIFPEAVSTDNNGYLKLDVHPINMAVYNAIRELDAKNQILKQENQYLKNRIIKLDLLEQELMKLKSLVKILINNKK